MDRKYELLRNDCINYEGRTLYRIKALRDFDDVRKGYIGGYIESEDNLSHDNYCWVYDNAIVCDKARVLGSAKVFGHAKIYDYAMIFDFAEINQNAEVYEEARIYDNSLISGNAKVYGNVETWGNIEIFGNARVYDEAFISDNAAIYGNANIHGSASICNYAKIHGSTTVNGSSKIYANALLYGNTYIFNKNIISTISMPFKKIFQHQCVHRILTAILTENDEILYTIGCQNNITEEKFIDRIHNKDGGLKENPHRKEYLELIPLINIYLKGEHNND